MADKFFRLLRLLQMIPRAPKVVDTTHIEKVLAGEGLHMTVRTIQRDLQELEGMGFGLECLADSKPFRWRFLATADAMLVPALDPQAALALRLVELHLERMLPKATLRAVQPHLQAAKKALEGKPVAKWLDKVRLIPRSQPLLPPKTDGNVVGVVHEALLDGKQIEARYRKRGAESAKAITLHPLGLVYRDSVAYLVAKAWDYDDVRLYPLHRFADAAMRDEKAHTPNGFDLDKFIDGGELAFRIGEEDIDLELVFEADAAQTLEETPLTATQTMCHDDDSRLTVRARVPDTRVLRSWILGFGEKVEVRAPMSLRLAIQQHHALAAKRYSAKSKV